MVCDLRVYLLHLFCRLFGSLTKREVLGTRLKGISGAHKSWMKMTNAITWGGILGCMILSGPLKFAPTEIFFHSKPSQTDYCDYPTCSYSYSLRLYKVAK